MTARQLKAKRNSAGVPGRLVCVRARIDRGRLSDIERGYVEPSNEELVRIEKAIDELIEAKEKVERVAAEAGWPMG